jgi:hypothetical protein
LEVVVVVVVRKMKERFSSTVSTVTHAVLKENNGHGKSVAARERTECPRIRKLEKMKEWTSYPGANK